MRRALLTAIVLAAVAAFAIVNAGAGGGQGNYRVRAIFDNAVSVISGEDVKVAGVKVGKVDSLDVTRQNKAAIVLRIDDPGFQDFRADASCIIRPQSLIGEKFVECTPTQPRAPGAAEAPPLPKIPDGRPGAGQRLLPLEHTSTPVDIDLINDIVRRPLAERLAIIVNELGAGLAGRGSDLRDALRRASPALRQTDRVLAILSNQDRVLADLARDSDAILSPLGRERAHVADLVAKANTTAQATAERGDALERTIQRLPAFLRQLRPTMVRLGALSDQAAPVVADLGAVAPSVTRVVRQLGPFTRAATPALRSLGDAAKVGIPALVAARPVTRDLRAFAVKARPVATNLAALTTSLKATGGTERILDYAFYQDLAINGFDGVGHYLRAGLIVNLCATYTVTPTTGCSANFAGAKARAAAAGPHDPVLARTLAVLRGADPRTALASGEGATTAAGPRALKLPRIVLPGLLNRLFDASPKPAPARSPAAGTVATPESATTGLLDFLFGSDTAP